MTQPAERRPIPGHRQYEIDEHGNVYRVEGRNKWKYPLQPLKQTTQKINGRETGYLYVTLTRHDDIDVNGEAIDLLGTKLIGVHRLVALCFHGPAPQGMPFVKHKDGNRSNNTPENVQWGNTRSKDKQIVINSTLINKEARIFADEPTEAARTQFLQNYPLTMEELLLP